VGVASGTDALLLALKALGIGPGDEVPTSANTFIATFDAISRTGATPVPVEPDPEYYTMEVSALRESITRRTAAILPVHLFGQPADMGPLLDLASELGLPVIEDAALEEWISYDFGEKNTVLQYALRSTGAGDRSPRSWHLQGSDDTKNWATLDSRTEIAFSGYEEKNFSVSTTSIGSFRYYRILITESNQGTRLALSLVKFFVAD